MQTLINLTEKNLLPDALVRVGIRRLLRARLRELRDGDIAFAADEESRFLAAMRDADIALMTASANEQHYELPTEFFLAVLGKRLKYSSCLWDGATDLDQAEQRALAVTTERAQIRDGHSILELGCGWGSLTLWLAEHFPAAHVTAVSNSAVQRAHIEQQCADRALTNVTVITADMNDFDPQQRFDRIVSLEMFEHMRNWPRLFGRVSRWLRDDGLFFMHVFCHATTPYPFVDRGPADWMTRFFFAGGMMPSDGLALRCQQHLELRDRWRWSGTHYSATLEAWLRNMDGARDAVMPILARTYGEADRVRWWVRWRLFFMACSELFAWDDGRKWYVGHYLFGRR